MPIPVVVPRLGWTMEQGVFVEWLKREGDTIRIGDPIFVLEGEKATQDIESTDAGVLKILSTGPRPGDTIDVGATVGYLLAEGEVWDGTPGATPAPAATSEAPAAEAPVTEVVADEPAVESNVIASTAPQHSTPRARRVADELGVDWKDAAGSGAKGRIREADVRAIADEAISIPMVANTGSAPVSELSAVAASHARRTIAERMLASAQQTAAVTLTTHVDATHLVALRKQFKAAADQAEVIPSLTDILVKLAAVALKQHPEVNSRWDDERIITSEEVHIGIAVDTPQALLVPVLRSVTRLTLRQVAVRSRDLIERARNRKVAVAELQGGTFTVTNLGMFGIDAFTPLLNPPQAAILGVGR
ncbi:MAG: dihydrolipoamide acetyltransferase family protein, partial [Planctomycetota bacterium]